MAETIEGKNPVLEALRSGHPVNKIMLAKGIKTDSAISEILDQAKAKKIPVEYVERHFLDRQSLKGSGRGIIALAASHGYATLDDLLAIPAKTGEPALFCLLDGIEDPANLGAILRTAGATGVHGIIIRSRRAAGLTSAVARTSAGAIEYVPVARVANISQTIETLKKKGIWITGIEMTGEVDYANIDFTLPSAIVIGSEGKGLSPLVRKHCDTVACIPMKGEINSLNASVAAALVMHWAFRQRMGKNQTGCHPESKKNRFSQNNAD
ncbi:MAG: 23S rRNA (guanosine(2251)-2'-O)-methyltransferase RlmB [Dehalococcoidales bacterium]|nr:MAG: 23S rRNA (guanosine(2251)-2'-O)-methyltransferase RlmB [Dehalococcoidales bacterium]